MSCRNREVALLQCFPDRLPAIVPMEACQSPVTPPLPCLAVLPPPRPRVFSPPGLHVCPLSGHYCHRGGFPSVSCLQSRSLQTDPHSAAGMILRVTRRWDPHFHLEAWSASGVRLPHQVSHRPQEASACLTPGFPSAVPLPSQLVPRLLRLLSL